MGRLNVEVEGQGGEGGFSYPSFLEILKLLRKRCFRPPHFESLVSPPPPPPHFQSSSACPVIPMFALHHDQKSIHLDVGPGYTHLYLP